MEYMFSRVLKARTSIRLNLIVSMNNNSTEDESTIMRFVQDYFSTFDKNRHMLHTLFPTDGTFIMLGNRMSGQEAIKNAICTMASTTHELRSIDIHRLTMSLGENLFMFQVLCAGTVEFGRDPQLQGFTASLLICFQKPNLLSVISFDERCQWPKLA